MTNTSIYKDIATRTDGSIFLGVVGPVRTGKSTFIKRFMDQLVLPNIQGDFQRERANDEMPQASSGRTIMTTEPKFIPETAAKINLEGGLECNVRLIDCVGYILPSSLGYIEGDQPRMVKTPWYEEDIPFNMAAEIGTKKVITEHSTIGLVVTTDGSISDIPREEYAEAEERVISELKEINKPFVVLLNCVYPMSESATILAENLSEKYSVPVIPVNCQELSEEDIQDILSRVLFEFPVKQISLNLPAWVCSLNGNHPLKSSLYSLVQSAAADITHIREIKRLEKAIGNCEQIENCEIKKIDLGSGKAEMKAEVRRELFFEVISENTGIEIKNDRELISTLTDLSKTKKEYMRIKDALEEVEATGYGIVMPSIEELSLEEPEIMRQGGRYGVRLRASAPSLHIMKANITTEVSPIVGSEKQSEDLVMYLLKEFEENPSQIWDSNIFGKSLHELVNEGLHTKLSRMPQEARLRMQETIERVINEGCSGLICIIL
ncbi:MAG: stage IV sporulation protein A [Acutalibacteraceae bacterium]|nr:stage IV sporulation protein A [Acutalibacteraceae bacterium]